MKNQLAYFLRTKSPLYLQIYENPNVYILHSLSLKSNLINALIFVFKLQKDNEKLPDKPQYMSGVRHPHTMSGKRYPPPHMDRHLH